MRILMINYEYPPLGGGAANACYHMLGEFSKNSSITIDLVTSSLDLDQITEEKSTNIRIYKIPIKKENIHYWKMSEILVWSIFAFFLCLKLLNKNSYDLCHCWFGWPSGLIGYFFQRKIPYIVALRGSDIPGYNPRLKILDLLLFRPLSKIVWKSAKKVVVLSENSRKMAKNILNRDFQVIMNGVDTNIFFPDMSTSEEFRLLYVGRLIERKGVQYIIDAIAMIHASYPNEKIFLSIVGSGNLDSELKILTQKYHLEKCVNFLGAVEHDLLPDIYRKHDVFILSSLNEALGNVTQEAIASGLALLTTETGAAELLDGNGFIIQKKDSFDIFLKISKFINEPTLLRRCKERSIEIAHKMTWKDCVDKYTQEYLKIIPIKE